MDRYQPTRGNSYGYVIFDPTWHLYEGGCIDNKVIEYLYNIFKGLDKNILTFKEACDYWIHNCAIQGLKCTKHDIQEAYTFCYGHGCEWE